MKFPKSTDLNLGYGTRAMYDSILVDEWREALRKRLQKIQDYNKPNRYLSDYSSGLYDITKELLKWIE